MEKRPIDELYDLYVLQASAEYRATVGVPVRLRPPEFSALLDRLHDFRDFYPGMALWFILDYKSLEIVKSDGDVEILGRKLTVLKDFYRFMHADYRIPYLRWRGAAFEPILDGSLKIDPMEVGYRLTVPMQAKDGQYYWFSTNAVITQVDANGRIVTILQTFYQEGRWSPRNLRPFEARLQRRNFMDVTLEDKLIAQISLHLIDEFTNAELDLLTLYAAGKTADEILKAKSWSRHTLHEYNANLLKKARNLFVYDFRNARDFASYCFEKGFIHAR